MPRVRLTGLFLFITAVFIALAAAATNTTHLRFQRPDRAGTSPDATVPPATADPTPELQPEVEFVSVPIVYPLLAVAIVGLGLWFAPAAFVPQPKKTRRRTSRRKASRRRR